MALSSQANEDHSDASRSRELDDLTLARARHGERAALTALVRHYESAVFALVSRMMAGRTALVDDVAQEVFLKVLRAIKRFEPGGPARLSTWILTIATRTCIDAYRKIAPIEDIPPEPWADDGLERAAATREMGRRVEAAMRELPEDWRAVLVLRAYHDFDYPEIAATLGVEIGTVKSRLSRAREALRQAVGRERT